MITRFARYALMSVLAVFALLVLAPASAMADGEDKVPSARSYTIREAPFEGEQALLSRADTIQRGNESEHAVYAFVLADTPPGDPEQFDTRAMNYVNSALPASDATSGHPTPGVVVFYIDRSTGEVGVYDGKGPPNSDAQKIKSNMRDALTEDPEAYAKAFEAGMGQHFDTFAPDKTITVKKWLLIGIGALLVALVIVFGIFKKSQRAESWTKGQEKRSETP